MEYRKALPLLAVTLGLAASVAGMSQQAQAEDQGLFSLTEVPGASLLIAEGDDKCGEGKCGSDKCGDDKCGDDHCGDDHCGDDHDHGDK